MVAERRDYVALDWVAAEIGDTLSQATAALDAYLENPGDVTRLRFCLTYIHQVYGTLKMVEFAGAALLAEEMETTAHALLAETVPSADRQDALQALKTALARLPVYLQQLQKERVDRPTALLALINDLRALRNDTLITESAIFSPLLALPASSVGAALDIPEGELILAAGKLRQMYQMAMLNYLRGHEPRENLNYLAKVCARLAKLAGGLASEELWKVSIALFEGLLNRSIALTPAVKSLLQQIDNQLREVAERGSDALRQHPPVGLLKNLLYYIAASTAKTRFISEVKQAYRLTLALPEDHAVEPEALAAVKAALSRQLVQLAEDLSAAVANGVNDEYGVLLLAELRRAQDTTALLGLNRAQLLLHDVAARIQSHRNDFNDLITAMRTLAADLIEAPAPIPPRQLFNDSEEAQEQLDKAHGAVLLESRNGLEQAKEAIIEFVANQWRHQCLEDVPTLLASIRGGLQLAGMERAANVLAACENYVRQDLLGTQTVPAWQLLDTLADAIASVDYYLERRAEGSGADIENIIEMAEDSVAALGYAVDGRIIERPAVEPTNVIPFPAQTVPDTSERYDDHAGLGATDDLDAAAEDAPESAREADFSVTSAPTASEEAASGPVVLDTNEPETAAEIAATIANEQPQIEPADIEATDVEIEPIAAAATFVPSEPAFAEGEEPDPEIAEIFIEEAREVLVTLDEYLPQWRNYPSDVESVAVIRRSFHTLKGSGRMVGATQIAELAWAVENMLNRAIDGTTQMDAARVSVVHRARDTVPAMIHCFEQRLRPDMSVVQPLIDLANELARNQTAAAVEAAVADVPVADTLVGDTFVVDALVVDATPTPETDVANEVADLEAVDVASIPTLEADLYEPAQFAAEFVEDDTVAFENAEFEIVDLATTSAEPVAELAEDIPLIEDIASVEVDTEADIPTLEIAVDNEDGSDNESDSDDESDSVLLEIFATEAITHLEVLDQFVRNARAQFGPAELDDNLQRALHTLKGSAHMAGVSAIAAVVSPVEHLVKEVRAAQLRADDEILELLETATVLLRQGLSQLDTAPHAPIAGAEDWTAWVEKIYQAKLVQLDEAESQTHTEETFSPALLNQFLGDAIELISAVADDLDLWRLHRLGDERQHTLTATICQVADTADALNIGAVSDLAQALQTLLRRGALLHAPGDDFFELGAMATERLIDMLDRLAANQEPQPDDSLLALLQDYEFEDHPGLVEPPLLDNVVAYGVPETESSEPPLLDAMSWGDAIEAAALEPVAEPTDTASELPVEELTVDELLSAGATSTEDDLADHAGADHDLTEHDLAEHDLTDLAAALEANFAEPAAESTVENDDLIAAFDAPEIIATTTADLGDFDADVFEIADEDAHPLADFDHLEGETVDLDAAFAASPPLHEHSSIPTTAVAEYLEAFLPPSEPLEQPPLPTVATSAPGVDVGNNRSDYNSNFNSSYSSTDNDSDAEIDAEILEIFLEEAADLLEALDETVHSWSNERDNPVYLDELQRLLHTLKGGARLAGLKNLDNLAHNFETLLINAQHQQRPADDGLMAEVQGYQDQLVRTVDAVKLGGRPADADLSIPEHEAEPVAETAAPTTFEPVEAVEDFSATDNNGDSAVELEAELDMDDDGVIVPFVRSSAPRSATPEPGSMPMALGDDVEELPDVAHSALLRRGTGPQEVVKISAQLLEQLVNLAGETSIARSRSEEQVNEFVFALDEMQITVERLQEQVRRLDIETEAQVIHRQEQVENVGMEGFDPLEFDRYSLLQQLSRSLLESASDLVDIKNTLADKSRDMETLLVQQARINTELQEGLMRSRMVPFSRMVPRLRRIVRQIAGELGKQVDFYVNNAEGELDRTVLERIVAPLEHMLRNAVDHGVESPADRIAAGKSARGTIQLTLAREGGEIALTLNDDGRGIDLQAVRTKAIDRGLMAASANLSDHEVLQFILESGFSTAKHVTQISGRGVGMDVVASEIKQLGGSLDIDSSWGDGTRFTVRLPFTVSVNRALMVNVGGDIYAIPLNSIEGIVRVSPFELEAYYQPEAPLFEYAGQPYLMRYMGALLRTGDRPILEGQTMPLPVLLVRGTDHSVAVQVDGLMGSREIVVKTLGPQFGMVHGLSGATVLGDGSVVVILDLLAMIRADAMHLHRDLALGQDDTSVDRTRPQLVMVVDDSVTVRKVTSRFLERQGMEVMLAKDGVDAISLLQESDRVPDVMLLDIEMPRMDGFEVASRIRHSSRWQDIPIIMITSRTGEKHRDRAFSLGVNKYLGKPYQEMVLLEAIYELTGTTARL